MLLRVRHGTAEFAMLLSAAVAVTSTSVSTLLTSTVLFLSTSTSVSAFLTTTIVLLAITFLMASTVTPLLTTTVATLLPSPSISTTLLAAIVLVVGHGKKKTSRDQRLSFFKFRGRIEEVAVYLGGLDSTIVEN